MDRSMYIEIALCLIAVTWIGVAMYIKDEDKD